MTYAFVFGVDFFLPILLFTVLLIFAVVDYTTHTRVHASVSRKDRGCLPREEGGLLDVGR